MHNLMLVHVADTTHKLIKNRASLGLLDILVLDNKIEELFAWTELR